ncbi:Hint domain-containing protein [Tabrizicola sp. M-4]|uniref:Hint domain-containing protein n=1 Tax=Tabrizicola sp. M-4 TaxID=3055847 RepID=UPI003DA83FA4
MGSPPNITGATTGSVTEDSGLPATGQLTETANNFANTWSIAGAATYGTATINPTTGRWTYVLNDAHPAVDALDGGQSLTDIFTVQVADFVGTTTRTVSITINGVTCFAADTLIDTPHGARRAIDLRPGDLVLTRDHGPQPLRWIGSRHVTRAEMMAHPGLQPVTLSAHALGPGLPAADLTVSRQHRLFLRLPEAMLYLDTSEVLLPAAALTGLPGLRQHLPPEGVTYVHLLLDRHEILRSHGVESESFFPGEQALAMLSPEDRAQVAALLAARPPVTPARAMPQGGTLRLLAEAVRRQRVTAPPRLEVVAQPRRATRR